MMVAGKLKSGEKTIMLIVLAGLFGILLWKGGVRSYPDTNSYLSMSPNREPGYALLLNAALNIAGEKGFFLVGLLQNGLTVFSIYMLICYAGEAIKSRWGWILTAICLILPHIMTPLFASSGLILSNSLLSEGITIPLYNLYFLFMWKAVWAVDRKEKYLGRALIFAFILTLVRGQMLVTLIAWAIIAVLLERSGEEGLVDDSEGVGGKKQKNARRESGSKPEGNLADLKKIFLIIVSFVAVLILRTLCVNSYNLTINGKFTGTTYGAVTIFSNVIYVTEEKDREAIEDDNLRALFDEIYGIAKEGQMLYRYAPEGFTEEAAFYSRMHDEIKDEAIYPVLLDYAEHEEGITDHMERLVRVDELASSMMRVLLPGCIWEWLKHYIGNILVGLIRTVAFLHPLFNLPALAGYGILFLMGVYCYRKDKKSRAAGLLFLTLLLTVGNAAAVALTIMCISRYMVYNMAFVYLSGFLLLGEMKEYFLKDREVKKE